MEDLFRKFNPWWEKKFETTSIKREKYISFFKNSFKRKDIEFITGLRRIGKTTIMKQLIEFLIKNKKINSKHICYLSLDSYSFRNYSIYDLIKIFQKISKLEIDQNIYVFFDEITFKKDFLIQLKNLYDMGNIKIYASSSSSSLLKDKNAYLTGRTRLIEIEPLDFKEFLFFKNLNYSKRELPLMKTYFEKYMELGGIPEYVLTEDPSYITNMVNDIIDKDIIAYYNIKKNYEIKDLFRLLCERVGKPITYSKLAKIISCSKDTIKQYINYFEETYLFSLIEKKGKLNEKILGEKKLYVKDIAIKNINSGFKDKGAIYENLIYNIIKNKKPVFILKEGIEIDFYYHNTLIEAKYGREMNEKQIKLFNSINVKNKIIANGVNFFINTNEI
jgi:uncharacterized protein